MRAGRIDASASTNRNGATSMNPLLQDLYGHQAWADAELWRAIEASERARNDDAIRKRLHHIHMVQRAFMWAVGDRAAAFGFSKPDDFAALDDLKAFARESHDMIDRAVPAVADRLDNRITMPWFKDPPLTLTIGEALAQCAMHSQWHRGQNATRLRELGGTPPTVDLIVWYWKDRPRPRWA
jgi:uncharacterized damage-inducible protein DinB